MNKVVESISDSDINLYQSDINLYTSVNLW